MEGRVTPGSTALSGSRVRSVSATRHRGTRVVRQVGAALTAGALSLFSGGIIGHALSASTTTLTSGTNPSVWGQSVLFTATITPVAPAPTGTVTFQDGGTNIAGCVSRAVAARVATCTTAALAVGSHSVTAVYSGNADLRDQHLSPCDTDGHDGIHNDGRRRIRQSVGERADSDVHRHGQRGRARLWDTYRDRGVSGWRRRHRRLRCQGCGGQRHGHVRNRLHRTGDAHHHRDLQR